MNAGLTQAFEAKNIGGWAYACGRLHALAERFFSATALQGLLELDSVEELRARMAERGYHGATLPEMLQASLLEDFDFLRETAPEPELANFLLLGREMHNLKACLKASVPASSDPNPKAIQALFQWPYRYEAQQILERIQLLAAAEAEHEADEASSEQQQHDAPALPAWMEEAIQEGIRRYRAHHRPDLLDWAVDQAAVDAQAQLAKGSKDRFVQDYLRMDRDVQNLESTLRCRALGYDAVYLEGSYLKGGRLSFDVLKALLLAEKDALAERFAAEPLASYQALLPYLERAEESRAKADYSKAADALRIAYWRQLPFYESGLAQVFVWMMRRDNERKNLRLIEKALTGELSRDLAGSLLRQWEG